MAKIAIVFEVPDDTDYAEVVGRMVAHRAFAQGKQMAHWSFDLEMRPVAAIQVNTTPALLAAAADARATLDQDHPWIPGGVFTGNSGLKPLLLALLDTITKG